MRKSPLAVVAALAVLVGCNDDREAQAQSPADPTITADATAPASQPVIADDGAVATTPGTGSVEQGYGWESRSTVESGASGSSAGTVPPAADDDKKDDQRGSVITEEGAQENLEGVDRSPQGETSGSLPSNDASLDRSAQQDSHRSTHAGEAGGTVSGVVRPELTSSGSATIGQDADDRAMVGRIRQAIVDDETLSYDARAVQVRAESERIVIMGTVPSEREAQRISSIAFRESGGRLVVNQLAIGG